MKRIYKRFKNCLQPKAGEKNLIKTIVRLPVIINMKSLFLLFLIFFNYFLFAQNPDSVSADKVAIIKDYRLNILANKESEVNTAILRTQARTAKGYRLMVLNTNDKDYAFKIRGELLQRFPEQKLYMWYSNPYIRLKFGNFKTKEEADYYRREISDMLDGANVYFLSETIEVPPDKDFDPDEMLR